MTVLFSNTSNSRYIGRNHQLPSQFCLISSAICRSIGSFRLFCADAAATVAIILQPIGFAIYPRIAKVGRIGRKPLLATGVRLVASMAEALKTHGVVPDVVDKIPQTVLSVTYPNENSVDIGKVLTPTLVKDQPKVTWNADANAFYTICMTDPDAPSRTDPKFREWHHWLVGNVPGSDVSAGEVLSEYIGSGPPKGTGLHRYVFLLYKQPAKLTFDEPRLTNRSVDKRAKFSIRKFAAKYNLSEPIAGNMYLAEFDDYVPILYKQLGE